MQSRWAAASDCSRQLSVWSNCSTDHRIERRRPHHTKEPSQPDGSFFTRARRPGFLPSSTPSPARRSFAAPPAIHAHCDIPVDRSVLRARRSCLLVALHRGCPFQSPPFVQTPESPGALETGAPWYLFYESLVKHQSYARGIYVCVATTIRASCWHESPCALNWPDSPRARVPVGSRLPATRSARSSTKAHERTS